MNEQHNIRLVVETILKDQDVLKKLAGDLNRLDQTNKNQGKTWRQMKGTYLAVAAALGGVTMATRAAYKAAREGSEIIFAETKFARWAVQIGTTADALMSDLIPAARGTASEVGMMKMALDLMSLGLADSHEEVTRLANVAVKLGMNMDQLVLTLTNKTIRRFDSLGVSVDGFKERWAVLKKTMSDEDAFTMAFLEQAERQLAITGEAADTTAGTYMHLESSWANFTNTLKTELASTGEGSIKWLAELLDGLLDNKRAIEDTDAAFTFFSETLGSVEMKTGGLGGVREDMVGINAAGKAVSITGEELKNVLEVLEWGVENTALSWAQLSEMTWGQQKAMAAALAIEKEYVEANPAMVESLEKSTTAAEYAAAAYSRMIDALDPGKLDIFRDVLDKMKFEKAGGKELQDFAEGWLDAQGNLKAFNGTAEEFEDVMMKGYAATLATKVEMGEMSLREARKEIKEYTGSWATADKYLKNTKEAMENFRIAEEALAMAETMGTDFGTAYSFLLGLIQQMGSLDGVKADVFINYIISTMGGTPTGAPTGPSGPGNPFGHGSKPGASDVKYVPQAKGGPLAQRAIVGEEGPEMIIDGIVIPAPITKALLALGLGGFAGFARGGKILDGMYTDNFNLQSYMNYTPPVYGEGGVGVAGTASDPSYVEPTVAAAEATAESTARTAKESTERVASEVAAEIGQSGEVQAEKLDSIYKVLLKQPTTDDLVDGMKSAVQEALSS